MERKCSDCDFWDSIFSGGQAASGEEQAEEDKELAAAGEQITEKTKGLCRLNPPTIHELTEAGPRMSKGIHPKSGFQFDSVWPATRASDWCGQFKPRSAK